MMKQAIWKLSAAFTSTKVDIEKQQKKIIWKNELSLLHLSKSNKVKQTLTTDAEVVFWVKEKQLVLIEED